MCFNLIVRPSEDTVGSWGLGIDILHLLIHRGMDRIRLLIGYSLWIEEKVG